MIKLSRILKKYSKQIAIGLILFIFLIVLYKQNKVFMKLKLGVDLVDKQIEAIENTAGKKVALEEAVGILRAKEDELKTKFIKQEDISLAFKTLSDIANATDVRIISMRPQAAAVFSSKGKGNLIYDNSTCIGIPIDLSVEAKFENLGEYMRMLESSPVGLFTVESFSLKKMQQIYPDLQMSLTVQLYFFGKLKKS
jgi:uncharacterized membrane protein YvbJ